ncbi:MAG: PH domain-containing protein [Planctomycetota bacterium]|nr:PH domain-containing protein [Planctomycetota bacterium]
MTPGPAPGTGPMSPERLSAEAAEPGVLVRDRALAMLPAELIQPDEAIILVIKPSPWMILLDALRAVTTIAITLAACLAIRDASPSILTVGRSDLILAAVGTGGIRLFWQFLDWMGRVYVLTDRRVIRVKGVFRIVVFEAPLKRIQHTTLTFSLRERLFGLGTIHFATAGTAGIDAEWRMIAEPLETHQTLLKAMNRYR